MSVINLNNFDLFLNY